MPRPVSVDRYIRYLDALPSYRAHVVTKSLMVLLVIALLLLGAPILLPYGAYTWVCAGNKKRFVFTSTVFRSLGAIVWGLFGSCPNSGRIPSAPAVSSMNITTTWASEGSAGQATECVFDPLVFVPTPKPR